MSFANQNEVDIDILKLHYCDPLGFVAAAIFKFTNNGDGNISTRSVKLYDRFVFPISRLTEPIFRNAFGKNVILAAKKK